LYLKVKTNQLKCLFKHVFLNIFKHVRSPFKHAFAIALSLFVIRTNRQVYGNCRKVELGSSIKDVRTKSREIDPRLSVKCPHWLNPSSRVRADTISKNPKFFASKRTSASEELP